ncbi:MAG: hypothetical protein ACLR5C_02750 [Bifidobacterium adolescentis]
MIGATIFAVVFFVFLIAICIGFIILQIRLSKMDSKWPGLVLPAITLLLSLVAAITVFARADIGAYGNMWNVVLSAFIAFLSNNVSTIVLAGIYLYQRDKINRRAELAPYERSGPVSRESPQPRPSDIALPEEITMLMVRLWGSLRVKTKTGRREDENWTAPSSLLQDSMFLSRNY